MSHRNSPLSETGRLRLARCVVEDGWPLRRAAERFQVAPTTAARWAGRYRVAGAAGMADRTSRPHCSPNQTPTRTERRIIKVRRAAPMGACPHRLPARAASLHGAPGAHSLRHGQTAVAGPPHRPCHPPDRIGQLSGSWFTSTSRNWARSRPAVAGASWATSPGAATPGPTRAAESKPRTAIQRAATTSCIQPSTDTLGWLYSELLADERKETAAAFWLRANAWFTGHGITVRKVLTDNGSCYRSFNFRDAIGDIEHRRTQPLSATNQRQSRKISPHPG